MKSTIFSLFSVTQRSSFLLLCMVIVSVITAACGPAKKYAGPYQPDEEIAVITPDDKMFTHVNLLSVDKTRLYTDESSIAILPGKHTLFLEAVLDYPFLNNRLYFKQSMTFEAEAGRTYTVHATILPIQEKGFAWITSDQNPETIIVKKYADALIPLSTYP